MLIRLRSLLINLMLSALLTACAGATQLGEPSISPPVTTQPQPQGSGNTITPIPQITLTQEATMPGPFPSPETEDNPLVGQAKQDLAQRLDVPIEDIELVQYEGVVWPDSSLGCPQPGMAYAQVLTPGYLIILTAGDKEYEYHASKSTEVIYCENPSPPIPGTPGDI